MAGNSALNIAYSIKRRGRYLGGRLNRAEGGEAEYPAWMNADTLSPMSGSQDEMTRALPDYESRDPNELAMLRHREMVRPQAGRQDFPVEHLANMAGVAASLTPAGALLAPEMMVGRGLAAGAQYAPKLTTAGLAGVGALAPSMAGGAEDVQGVKDLQTKLRDAGYYVGKDAPIDGNFGPATKRAKAAFDADEQARRAGELKNRELATAEGANTAATETARANQKTAEAKIEADRLAAEQAAAYLERQKAGDERMREIEKNISPVSRAIRDYSGPAGMAGGMVAGGLSRGVMQSLANRAWKENAAAADALMATPAKGTSAAALASRVAKTNEFWRKGSGEVPFVLNAEKAPGYALNPKAWALDNLYKPQIHPVAEAAGMAPPLVEEEVSRHYRGKAEDELVAAQEAAARDPSEINIQRIQTAKDNVALYTGMQRVGQVWATTQGLGGVGSRFLPKSPNLRPNMAAAEQEQTSLQKILRDAQEKAAKKSNAALPRQIAPKLPSVPGLTREAARARNGSGAGAPSSVLHAPPTESQGGGIRSPMDIAYAVRRQNRAEGGEVHAGPILSSVPGRTDNHPMDVEEGAYILPADHISSLGEGNTMAGMEVVNHMIESLGVDPQHRGQGNPVPINAAGGEVAIPPEVVMTIGGGDIARGHKMLDDWVLLNRKKHISTLRGLPGPAKS